MLGDRMPPDPFRAGTDTPDLALFAANCYAMYTAFIAAGFDEAQALRAVIELMAAFARNATPVKDPGNDA